jgi:hypothetical protein
MLREGWGMRSTPNNQWEEEEDRAEEAEVVDTDRQVTSWVACRHLLEIETKEVCSTTQGNITHLMHHPTAVLTVL